MNRILRLLLVLLPCVSAFGQAGKPIASVDSVAALVARSTIPDERVIMTGWRTNGDFGAHRILRHVPDSATSTNLGCVFASARNGRYFADDCDGGELNVQWFGAVPDGSTDSTAAFQSAITVAKAKRASIRVPGGAGAYLVTSVSSPALTLDASGLRLVGDGRDVLQAVKPTVIEDVSTNTLLQLGDGATDLQGIVIENLTLKNSNSTANSIGILLSSNLSYCSFRGIGVYGFGAGVKIGYSWGHKFVEPSITAGVIGMLVEGPAVHVNVIAPTISYQSQAGVWLTNSAAGFPYSMQFIGGTISHTPYAVMADGGPRAIVFRGQHWEDIGTGVEAGIVLKDYSYRMVFEDGLFVSPRTNIFQIAGDYHRFARNTALSAIPSGCVMYNVESGAQFTDIWQDSWPVQFNRGTGASVTFTNTAGGAANNGILTTDYVLADGGSGYSSRTYVHAFHGSGTGARFSPTIVNGVVTALTVTNAGSGYTTAPTSFSFIDEGPWIADAANNTIINGIGRYNGTAGDGPVPGFHTAGMIYAGNEGQTYLVRPGEEPVSVRTKYHTVTTTDWNQLVMRDTNHVVMASIGANTSSGLLIKGGTNTNAGLLLSEFGLRPFTARSNSLGAATVPWANVYADQFRGQYLYVTNGYASSTPPTSNAVFYVFLNGSGKQELVVRWQSGATNVIATEP